MKLTMHQTYLLNQMKTYGFNIHVEFTGDRKQPLRYYAAGGETINVKTVKKPLSAKKIKPVQGENLFSGVPQSYELVAA